MAFIVPVVKQPHELLNHILDWPDLPAIIQRLDAGVLVRLIRHIGLEDSCEIVAMATADQLEQVFDEDLWSSDAPGQAEVFDAERFGVWLAVMMESGAGLAVRKIRDLDEDLVTLALCRLIYVVGMEDLALRMANASRSTEDDLLDKVIDSTLNHQFDTYLLVARNHENWEVVLELLLELNELDYPLLSRLLERCCRISSDYIEDHGGLLDVLSAEDMLMEDMVVERETRRESKGYVTAAVATDFFYSARTTPLNKLIFGKTMTLAVRQYFRVLEKQHRLVVEPPMKHAEDVELHDKSTDQKIIRFLQTLQSAEVLPVADQKRLDHSAVSVEHHLPLARAIGRLPLTDTELSDRLRAELTFLSNALISGCPFQGRVFRPVEAAEAASSTCNLGAEHLLNVHVKHNPERVVKSMVELIYKNDLVTLFQVGWNILYTDVVLVAAEAIIQLFHKFEESLGRGEQAIELHRLTDELRGCISAGQPWECGAHVDDLLQFQDGEVVMALSSLVQVYPTIPDHGCYREGSIVAPFIYSKDQIVRIRTWLESMSV